mmetsp:Transcript_37700/g.82610  ORF Transcript_37700/g.82610 Transcript_37700/m.82610 type:complete len:447 (+) Transcript_37700:137-1477(+)
MKMNLLRSPAVALLALPLIFLDVSGSEAFVSTSGVPAIGSSSRLRVHTLSHLLSVPSQTAATSTILYMNKKKKKKNAGGSSKKKAAPGSGGGKGFGGAATVLSSVLPKSMTSFQYAGSVLPGVQSPQRVVTDPKIMKPDYSDDGIPKNRPQMLPWVIEQKTPEEIAKMRAAGRVAREVLDIAGRMVKAGINTDEIDAVVHEETLKRGAYPSPLNYHGFPKSCCTSVNEVVCHGIPDDRKLLEGDIINVDITCYLDGYHGDCSEMFVAGDTDEAGRDLIQTTYDCWVKAMEFVQPGNDYKDIGAIIEDHITAKGYTTVKKFCGHGIGTVFHCNPNIFHYRNSEPNGKMAPGHTFTIEPMICEGTSQCLSWPDDWTATTTDGKRSAQFEHTLLVTPDGVEALTGKIETSPVQWWEKESKVHQGVWLGTTPAAKKRMEELREVAASSSG